jgi:hypothetical protein
MKYRKRKLILEKKQEQYSADRLINRFSPLNYRELLRENRFCINLESDNDKIAINPENIHGIDFFDDNLEGSFIVISCVIFVVDNIWLNHFKKINICQISFLNPIGDVVKFLDYDVSYQSSNYNISYNSDNPLIIKIKYKIF